MVYGVLDFYTNQVDDEIYLTRVQVLNLDTFEKNTISGTLRDIFIKLSTLRIDCFLIINGSRFFGFIDYYCTTNKLPTYEDLNDNSGLRKRLQCEAWSYKNGDGAQYARKLWLKSKYENTRHFRIHAISFINLTPVIGVNSIDDFGKVINYEWSNTDYITYFARCVLKFDSTFKLLTGENFLGIHNLACWTMGGAARKYYLKLRYPEAKSNRLKLYQYSHPINIKLEYFLRHCKLLPAGLLYAKYRKKLLTGIIHKYDVNSLFAYVERDLPELGSLIKSSFEEYNTDKNGIYEYILIFNNITLKSKRGMPRLFCNPFETYSNNPEFIEINQEWAIFAPLFKTIQLFYDIIDFDIHSVYKARKNKDIAIQKYVDNLYSEKASARARNDKGTAFLVKFLLVNLHGKFAQKSIKFNDKLELDFNSNTVIKNESDEIIDEWKEKHFDYVRGAYIYSMARVKIMEYIYLFKNILPAGETLENHIFYDDTDSIITDLEAPKDIADQLILGKLKLEEVFTAFECVAPKTYWGRTIHNEIKITCAGIDREALTAQLKKRLNTNSLSDISDKELHNTLCDETIKYEIRVLTRIKGGNGYITQTRPLTNSCYTDEIF